MKQTNKLLLLTAALTMGLGTSAAFAQDFDDFGGFDDSFGDDTSASSLTSGSKLEVSGSASLDLRAYVDSSDKDDSTSDDSDSAAEKIEMEATPSATVDLSYSGNKSDMELSLCVDADRIQAHPEDVIDELLLRGRFGDYFTLEAGKMKLVWGKGDKLHVLDNFNADDYTDFIIPDYLDRRISTPMVRGLVSLPFANLNIEGVYTPFLPVDRFATSGRWTPAQVTALTSGVTNAATTKVAAAFTDYTSATATVGGAGSAYEISKESAAKAKAALESASAAFDRANSIYTDVNTKYQTLQKGYEAYQAAMADSTKGMLLKAKGVSDSLTFESFCAECATFQGYASYLSSLSGAQALTAISYEQFAQSNNNPKDQNVSSATLESLRKGYSEASAAYYAATAAKETAQATYDSYTEAEAKALLAYNLAKANAKSAGEAYMLALTYANSLSADPSVIYPDLWSLKYGQFGGRATWTLGMVDMGISYYNGWYKQPSFNASKLDSFISTYLANGSVDDKDKFLAYDKKQTFGLEASSIIWHFNVRGEFAYNLTDDTDGTDPWVHNNSIAWLGGFDIDLPFWNANLNVQETGTFILHGSDCDTNLDSGLLDVDYAANGYSNNKLVCNFTTSFMNDKIAPEVTVLYGFENKDLVVMPKLSFKADQNLTLAASGMYIWCGNDNSEFKSWEKNSFVNLSAEYKF